MNGFSIIWHQKAEDDIKNLEKDIRERIIKKLGSIKDNPLHFIDRLESYNLFKLRVGDYRAILEISIRERLIKVYLMGHRSKVYQELKRRMEL